MPSACLLMCSVSTGSASVSPAAAHHLQLCTMKLHQERTMQVCLLVWVCLAVACQTSPLPAH